MKPAFLILDDFDSRREIHGLLHRLPPRIRIEFLAWACKQVPKNNANRLPEPAVWKMAATVDLAYRCETANLVLTNEIYSDVLQLAATFQLDLVATAKSLERLVRTLRV